MGRAAIESTNINTSELPAEVETDVAISGLQSEAIDETKVQFNVVTVDEQGEITKRERNQAGFRTEYLGNGVNLELISIPSGDFQMGSPAGEGADDERPQHPVTVNSFWMGKYPVTQEQWKAVAALPKVGHDLDADPSHFKGDNRPVESVPWHDAVEFCKRLSQKTGQDYRLPSEAEWEYACRAGTETPFHFGSTITTDLANYNGNAAYGDGPKGVYRVETTPVGSFNVANAFGLYDMHGNVWEWCLEHWHKNYQGAPTDGSAWITDRDDSSRVLRGGSWSNAPGRCRAANRIWYDLDYRYSGLGLRVVCDSARTF
ncbi:MAG: formylglycine-generating enzyme family protein [Cyanothece sp. SIO1E1]|nr:formylglycine-generating enzyme family protein [Cyanothece sp. SIO1E1]